MSTVCPVCERPVTGSVLCQVTTTDLSRRLAEVPAVVAELEITFTRQSVTSAGRDGGKSAETPLPYGAAASDAVRQLTDVLRTWARAIDPDLSRTCSAVTAATHLRRRINQVRQHAMAEKIYDQVTAAIAHAYEVIDREPDLVPAGQCGADLPDGTRCEETLYGDPARSTVRCDVCGTSRDLDQAWMLEGARELEWTATEIAAVTPGVTASMVRGYARRGRLIQRGTVKLGPDRRVPTYRVGDVLDLLTQAKEAS